jgi:hypothetical protein
VVVRKGLTVCLVALMTVVLYMVWLGWDQDKYRVPGTNRIEARTRRGR